MPTHKHPLPPPTPPNLSGSVCRPPRLTTPLCPPPSEFVVSLISDWFLEAANHTSGEFPPEVDEMMLAGLTPRPSVKVRAGVGQGLNPDRLGPLSR